MKPTSKVYGKTHKIPIRKNEAVGFSGGTHAQSDGGRSGWLLMNRDPFTYFTKQYNNLSVHAETMDLQRVREARQKEAIHRSLKAKASESLNQKRQANAKTHRDRMSRRMSYYDRVKRAMRGSRLKRSPEKYEPGPFGTNPRLERDGDERNYWLNWKEGEDAYSNGDIFPRVRSRKSAWAETKARKLQAEDFFPNDVDISGGHYAEMEIKPGSPITTPSQPHSESRVAHMSNKLMAATMGKIFQRSEDELYGRSSPTEMHVQNSPKPIGTDVYDEEKKGPKMAFGHRVDEDSGRDGWAYQHSNNQIKAGIIYGDSLLHLGNRKREKADPTKKEIRNKKAGGAPLGGKPLKVVVANNDVHEPNSFSWQ